MNHGNDSSPHAATAAHADDGNALYVITLEASVAPMPMRAPAEPELAGLAVFRSRQVEDGRERFRLHLGFFNSEEAAAALLPRVRESYPAAIVARAPEGSMGSLEDTGVARFSILKPVPRPAAAAPAPKPVPRPAPAPAATVAAAAAALSQRPPVARAAPATVAPAAVATRRPATPLPAPRVLAPNTPPAARAPAAPPAAPTRSLLDAPRPPTFEGRPAAAPKPAAGAPVAPAAPVAEAAPRDVQHYAVQLIWNNGPIDLDKIPVLAIFNGYLLYAVESEPGPRRFYGVRLGFYNDALSARLVAQYVRSEFKGVAVVPVSQREMTRASTAAIRLSASRRSQSSSVTRSRWPASALAVDPANLRRAFIPGVS